MTKTLWVTEVTFPETANFPGLVVSDTWDSLEVAKAAGQALLEEVECENGSIDIIPIQVGEASDISAIIRVCRMELDDSKKEAEEEMKDAARRAAEHGVEMGDIEKIAETVTVMARYLTDLINDSDLTSAAPPLLAYTLLMLAVRLAHGDGIPENTLKEMLTNIFAWDFASKDPITVN